VCYIKNNNTIVLEYIYLLFKLCTGICIQNNKNSDELKMFYHYYVFLLFILNTRIKIMTIFLIKNKKFTIELICYLFHITLSHSVIEI
jgi:hypothetical protein